MVERDRVGHSRGERLLKVDGLRERLGILMHVQGGDLLDGEPSRGQARSGASTR